MKKISISKQKLYLVLAVFFLGVSFVLAILLVSSNNENSTIIKKQFDLIDSKIADKNIEDFLTHQKNTVITYAPLKSRLNKIISDKTGTYGIYFEDLNSGSWIGINEKEVFTPASLLKITTVAGVLKMVEEEEIIMDKKIMILEEDLDERSGILNRTDINTSRTIQDLIIISINYSDNTANHALFRTLTNERFVESRLSMGMPLSSWISNPVGVTTMSPKQYSNMFRTLYLSSYLKKSFSQWTLTLLSETPFDQWIVAGVPKDVRVSHKVGYWNADSSYHDCGIVYTKKTNYLLCVMTKNVSYEESIQTIPQISKEIYDYVDNS